MNIQNWVDMKVNKNELYWECVHSKEISDYEFIKVEESFYKIDWDIIQYWVDMKSKNPKLYKIKKNLLSKNLPTYIHKIYKKQEQYKDYTTLDWIVFKNSHPDDYWKLIENHHVPASVAYEVEIEEN